MDTVEAYILDQEGSQREIFSYLDHLIMSHPGVTSGIRYRVPFYFRKTWFCYLNPLKGKKKGLEMSFIRGNELPNSSGLLQFKGRKQVAGIEITDLRQYSEETLRELIMEALILDEEKKYASKRTKNS